MWSYFQPPALQLALTALEDWGRVCCGVKSPCKIVLFLVLYQRIRIFCVFLVREMEEADLAKHFADYVMDYLNFTGHL